MINFKKLNTEIQELIPQYCEQLPNHNKTGFEIDNSVTGVTIPDKNVDAFNLMPSDKVKFIPNKTRMGIYRFQVSKEDTEQFSELDEQEKRTILLNLVSDVKYKKLKQYNITALSLKFPGLNDVIRLTETNGIELRFCFLFEEA